MMIRAWPRVMALAWKGRSKVGVGGKEIQTFVYKIEKQASLVTQWLRIHLPMQGTRVRTLVQEDPTCCGTTKPVHHNC